MRRAVEIAGLLLLGCLLALLALIGEALWEMRGLEPALPEVSQLAALGDSGDGPVRLGWVNTASQPIADGRLGLPVFVLEWADGRLFLIDAGMDREPARDFGRLLEWVMGGDPSEPRGAFPEQVGAAVSRVAGVGLTHLHTDHAQGLIPLCRALDRPLPLFQTPWQLALQNSATASGRAHIAEAGCVRPQELADGPLFAGPGFPGLAAFPGAGHTPGSTVFAARVAGRTWLFAGDITNSRADLLENRPKPWLYSRSITPENTEQLARLRPWLAALDARPDFAVVVSHDEAAWGAIGLCPWPECPAE